MQYKIRYNLMHLFNGALPGPYEPAHQPVVELVE